MRITPVHSLIVINLLLSISLGWSWVDENGQWRNIRWVEPAPIQPEIPPAETSTLPANTDNAAQYLAILERPVFAPDRRPPPPPAPPPPPDPMADVQITGIFSGDNAVVLARVEGKMRRVKINESVGAWTLKSVSGREATFVQGDQTRQVQMAYTRLSAAPGQTPAVSAQASASASSGSATTVPNYQEEARERLRRRNEIRAARGLPLVTD